MRKNTFKPARPMRILWLVTMLAVATTSPSAAPLDVNFAGAESFSPDELRSAIALQLDDVASMGLTPATADDAAWFLRSYYRKQGFSTADVTSEVRGSQLVLKVREGMRTTIGPLIFKGNRTFPDATLYEFMVGVTQERLAQSKLPYNEVEVAAGAGRIRDYYASEGFLDATVDTSETRILPGGKQAEVVVRISEGTRYTVGNVEFTGRPMFGREELLKALALKPATAFTPFTADEMQRSLESFYRSKGCYSAKVTASRDVTSAKHGRVPVTLHCDPGPKFRVTSVQPHGTDRLSPGFIVKRFNSLTNKIYDPARLEERYRELVKTGLFRSLRVQPTPDGPDSLALKVEVEEAKAKSIGFEIGYGAYDGASAGVTLGDRNFLGSGRAVAIAIQYSQRGLGGELSYLDPWFLDTPWTLRARLYSQLRDEEGYSKQTEGLRLDFDRTLIPHLKIGGYVVWEGTTISDSQIDESLIGSTKYLLTTGGILQTIDYRDDVTNPTRGWVLTTLEDINALDSELAFARLALRYSWYRSFGRSLLGIGLRSGWIIPTGGTMDVPIDLRYFNGGGTTVRSFNERQLGPKSGGNPLGGQFYTVANIEWDFPIIGALGGALFTDAGNLLEGSTVSLDDMRFAIGVGLRYQLPIGPMRLDYGYNPDRREGEDLGAFHFSFGFAF